MQSSFHHPSELSCLTKDMSNSNQTHVALFPSAGMGHLIPFLRLGQVLIHHNCKLTLITPQPAASLADSQLISSFLDAFPQVNELKFHLLPLDPAAAAAANCDYPFFLQFETIRRSVHLLSPLLAALSPPLSALIYDVTLISSVLFLSESLNLPNYMLFTTGGKMLSLFAYYPIIKMSQVDRSGDDFLHIHGVGSIPKTSLPPLLQITNGAFEKIFSQDGQKIKKVSGILINTFEAMEGDLLTAFNSGKVVDGLPLVTAVGPLPPCDFENSDQFTAPAIKWLDNLPPRSVVYISFSSRTAVSKDQIKEIGKGLVSSGYKFLWALKDRIVDKEEKEGLYEVLGEELMESMNEKGMMVVKNWVNQYEVLAHNAVGGFISHCGWISVMEAAMNGVRIMAWPQHGDQMINAQVIAKEGLGMWDENWGWNQQCFVKGEELGERIKELMESQVLKTQAAKLKEQAMEALGVGGNCDKSIQGLIQKWKEGE